MTDHFRAACYAQDLVRHATAADALAYLSADTAKARTADTVVDLIKTADALGFVVLSKADHVAMTGFLEELRDFRPTIHRSYRPDPQDHEDDLMPVGEFQMFQDDAALIGKKVKAQVTK